MNSIRFMPSVQKEQLKGYIPPLTYLKCESCGTINSRPHIDGDYIFKKVEEKCPKCGGTDMIIISIHVEERTKHSIK
ncbi:MAG: hypothetical protein QXI27_02450 [Nitrososphaerota archaeon]